MEFKKQLEKLMNSKLKYVVLLGLIGFILILISTTTKKKRKYKKRRCKKHI